MEGGEGCLPCCRTYKTKILKLPFVAAIHHKLACRSPNCVYVTPCFSHPHSSHWKTSAWCASLHLWRRRCWLVVSVAR